MTDPTTTGEPLTKSALKKLQKEKEKEARKAQVAARLVSSHDLTKKAAEKAEREAASPDYSKDFYGSLPMNQSLARSGIYAHAHLEDSQKTRIRAIDPGHVGSVKIFVGRVHTSRPVGAKMVFLNLRQRLDTIQAILTGDEHTVSKQMLKFATK